jgi:hypothetical protein
MSRNKAAGNDIAQLQAGLKAQEATQTEALTLGPCFLKANFMTDCLM